MIYGHIIHDGNYWRLVCIYCGKSVSSQIIPVPTEMGNEPDDPGFVLRAIILCPECFAGEFGKKK